LESAYTLRRMTLRIRGKDMPTQIEKELNSRQIWMIGSRRNSEIGGGKTAIC